MTETGVSITEISKEIEAPLISMAKLAGAVGIHLIIATHHPTEDIITGPIQAYFPSRMAFRVTSSIDSRTILDKGRANHLLGRGDMLLYTGTDLVRLQCAFVDKQEVDKVTEFIGSQREYPYVFSKNPGI